MLVDFGLSDGPIFDGGNGVKKEGEKNKTEVSRASIGAGKFSSPAISVFYISFFCFLFFNKVLIFGFHSFFLAFKSFFKAFDY